MHTRHGQRTKLGLLIFLLGSTLGACLKPEKFPDEPSISYKSFEQFGDSASLTISFTDGDGDVGLDESDSSAPFDTASPYYNNLFVDYEELRNGTWTPITFEIPLCYRIPRITPTGQNKALEGEIAVAIEPWPIVPGNTYDTVRFHVRLYDRALNESNRVTSDPIKVVQ